MKNELNEYGENLDCRSLNRWRLILGSFSNLEIDNEYSEIDEALNFLYDREYTQNDRYSLDNFNNSNSSLIFKIPPLYSMHSGDKGN